MPLWEREVRTATAESDQVGMDCNASGPCAIGDPGGMVPIEPSAEDMERLRDIVQNIVIKRWAERCGTQKCVDEWNETVGKVVGMEAKL